MDNIRAAILSTCGQVCAFMDNEIPEALHFYSDELHSYLDGAANTFSFTASARHEDSKYLVKGNKLSFRYRNKDYYFNIMKERRTEYTVEIGAYSLMFELLNDELGEYKASRAMTFAEYLEAFDTDEVVELNLNEVSDKAVTNEWTGTSTILARIFSLATVFDAEAELVPELNKDYSLKRLLLNVYKKNDGECQGIGRRRTDITLRYGVNVKGITKTAEILDLRTAIRPAGKDGLTIAVLDKTEYDADGNIEFRSPAGDPCIYAVQARDRFPSNTLENCNGRYIMSTWSYDTDNANTLYGQSLAQLRKICEPKVTYEVDGYFDTDIGDTVSIADEEYIPPLYLEARVTEQVRSFTDPSRNKTTFGNFVELQTMISEDIIKKVEVLIKENKVYTCSIASDNGIVFKNGEGTTKLTAVVKDNGVDVTNDFSIFWYKDNIFLKNDFFVTIAAEDVAEKAVYRFEAVDAQEKIRGSYEVTVTDVSDGKDGDPGEPGKDGKTSYFHVAYATSEDGRTGFSTSISAGKTYIGQYIDFTEADSTDPTKYSWTLIKGDKGDDGGPGPAGKDGVDGKMLYGISSTAAATADKVATITPEVIGFLLYTGVVVSVKFTVTNTAANPTLNINETGAKPIYYRGAAISAGYLAANRTYMFCYNGTQWEFIGDVNTDSNTYDRTRFQGAVKASAAITAGNIIVGNASGYHHLKTGGAFDISYPILYAGAAIASAATGTNNYTVIPFVVSTTQSIALTAYKAVYIKGKLNGTVFTPASTAPLTQTVPVIEDGYCYLYLGMAYSVTSMYLMAEHPLYRYVAGAFRESSSIFYDLFADNITAKGVITGAEVIGGKITNNFAKTITTPKGHTAAVSGVTKMASGIISGNYSGVCSGGDEVIGEFSVGPEGVYAEVVEGGMSSKYGFSLTANGLKLSSGANVSELDYKTLLKVLRTPVFVQGTTVVNGTGANYVSFLTLGQMQTLLAARGATFASGWPSYVTIVANNGDGGSNSVNLTGVEYWGGSYSSWWAYFDAAMSGPYRINYAIIYDPNQGGITG